MFSMDAWLRRWQTKKRIRLVITVIVSVISLIQPSFGYAEEIAIISHKAVKSVQKLADLTAEKTGFKIDSLVYAPDMSLQGYQAVVLAGAPVVQRWQRRDLPAIAVFVSRDVAENAAEYLSSAIYIEPPLSRQLSLAEQILGRDSDLGVLLSKKHSSALSQLQHSTDRRSVITPYFIEDYTDLNRALSDLLKNNDALVGVYEPELFSSANIKNILITAYRQNKPLIGPSSSYIKAGALASTFSDLNDIAQRLSEVLLQGLNSAKETSEVIRPSAWPEPGYNPYFHVRYNKQVGRSLNLTLPDEKALTQKLISMEVTP